MWFSVILYRVRLYAQINIYKCSSTYTQLRISVTLLYFTEKRTIHITEIKKENSSNNFFLTYDKYNLF